jgi:hypothetical protein
MGHRKYNSAKEKIMSEQEVLNAMAEESAPSKTTDLDTIRQKAVELRDFYLEKTYLENQLKALSDKIVHTERHELIDMFNEAQITSVTVEAKGNYPAFIAERETVYGAKIPDERRMEALEWFDQQGHGDLVKSVITIQFGMQEHERRLAVMKLLDAAGVEYYTNESVHHMTLKAFVKRELTKNRVIPMDLLGAYVFDEVKIK